MLDSQTPSRRTESYAEPARHWLRQKLPYIWGTLILGTLGNIVANLITLPTDTAFSKIILIHLLMTYPIPVFTLLGFLVLLTIFSWTRSRRSDGLSTLSPDQQNRERMLKRLHHTYDDLMEQSLQGAAWLELGLANISGAVRNTANLLLRMSNRVVQPLPPGTLITEVYDTGHELLILGEPGAGKSTVLLDLAQKLVARAEQDPKHRLPVILPLSSWAIKRPPLQNWIAEQLTQMYKVPRRLSEQWVQEDGILPLLDGLDEMEETARAACIAAINAYHGEHLASLVVCSRTTEYEAAAERHRLALLRAIIVQPLTHEDVDNYLVRAGEPLAGLRSAIKENDALREVVTTPLMLSVLMLTYRGTTLRELPSKGTLLQQQVWRDYIKHMVERKGTSERHPLKDTCAWLSWLAQQMERHNLAVFYIEQMQPDWQQPATQAYEWFAVKLPGFLLGMFLGLLVNALTFNSFDLMRLIVYAFIGGHIGNLFSSAQLGKQVADRQVRLRSHIVRSLIYSIVIGLGVYLGAWLSVGQAYSDPYDLLHNGAIMGLSGALSSFLLCMLFREGNPQISAKFSSVSAKFRQMVFLLCSQAQKLVGRYFQRGRNRPNPPLSQPGSVSADSVSWERRIWNGVLVGLWVGPVFGLGTWLSSGIPFGIQYGLTYWLAFGTIGVLLSIIPMGVDKGIYPTEILTWSWRSLLSSKHRRHTLFLALSLGGGIGLISGLSAFLGHWLDGHSFSFGVGVIVGIATIPVGMFAYGLTFVMAYWSLFGLFAGLSSEKLDKDRRVRPNEGIRRSLRISVSVGLSSGLVCMLIGILSTMLYFGLYAWLGQGLTIGVNLGLHAGFSNALYGGLWTGVVVGLQVGIFGALLAGAPMGGLAYLRHYVLRCLLWRSHKIPFNYSRFLDRAAECILLRKVGGGYMFIHREFQDYMASFCSCGYKDDRQYVQFCPFCGKRRYNGR